MDGRQVGKSGSQEWKTLVARASEVQLPEPSSGGNSTTT